MAFLHGREALAGAQAASKALFSGDVRGLDETTLGEVFAETPHTELPSSRLSAGVAIVDLLVETGLASSKREAREFLGAGSVAVSGAKVEPEHVVREQDLLPGQVTLLRRGKKKWHVIRWTAD